MRFYHICFLTNIFFRFLFTLSCYKIRNSSKLLIFEFALTFAIFILVITNRNKIHHLIRTSTKIKSLQSIAYFARFKSLLFSHIAQAKVRGFFSKKKPNPRDLNTQKDEWHPTSHSWNANFEFIQIASNAPYYKPHNMIRALDARLLCRWKKANIKMHETIRKNENDAGEKNIKKNRGRRQHFA